MSNDIVIERGGEGQPAQFVISEPDGSAYYLTPPDDRGEPGIVQVPLGSEGVPTFEDLGEGFFGGGEVDFEAGFEEHDAAGRARVHGIREALKAARA